ncbi:molybdate-anion transporter isoform X1 [Patella vulgata]|uniref:molybdate-anion transporter isoform X1 n=1 Tax=Patella vulgata TaxID=6465 RepID=UPI0024A7C89F|nr:molybdate-anion transporter isoform X1 [Patella vulgata]
MNIFLGGFWFLCILCAFLYLYTRSTLSSVNNVNFNQFQRSYLMVYLLAMAGDWLQGPHVYALYENYGMTTHQIDKLFVAGFGSSMMVGTIVGSFADRYGRKTNCVLYGVLYGLACVTKHFNNFWILMLGRLLGGTATSILYSAFESWLIFEHNKRNFEPELLSNIFSNAVLGNSLVAIIAGLVAQYFADMFGFVAPFDLSMGVLTVMIVITIFTWPENYGNQSSDLSSSFKKAITSIRTDPKVLCLGLIQSLFEGSMYIFVLEWTPALTPHTLPVAKNPVILRNLLEDKMTEDGHRGSIPHGHIFAAFMVAIMIGSSIFKLLTKYTSVESFMRIVLLTSALALLTPIFFAGNQTVVFIGFLVFEACVGIFWPSLGTMRGKYVPEETRATIMNFFRIPLNLIVIIILLQDLSMSVIFRCCAVFLLIAAMCQQWLYSLYRELPKPLDELKDGHKLGQEEKVPLKEVEGDMII